MKFKYADTVEIISGFYEGQKGIVFSQQGTSVFNGDSGMMWEQSYGIHIPDDDIIVKEQHLKLLKREKENNGTS